MNVSIRLNPAIQSAIAYNPLMVPPDTTVMVAIAAMGETGSSCVLVVEDSSTQTKNRRLVGILTERDLVRLSINAQLQPLDQLPIQAVMSYPVITLSESDCTDLGPALTLFQSQGIRHLPVLDEGDRLVGLLAQDSLTKSLAQSVSQLESEILELSEQHQTEKNPIAGEEHYRQIVETTLEGIWIIDPHNRTSYVNSRLAQMLGYRVEEMLGKSLFDFMDEEGRQIATINVERRKQGIKELHDFRFQTKTGQDVWTLISTNPLHDDAGNYIGALAMLTDISDRKRAENAMQALVTGTAAVTGAAFFPALVESLAAALGCAHTLVSEWKGDRLQTRAFWSDRQLQPNFSYSPENTPCQIALKKGAYFHAAQIQQDFPNDLDLVTLNAESYLGIALTDATGKAIGLLCVLDVQPIDDEDVARLQPMLQIFAARAAAELAREQATQALEQLNEELESRVAERTAALSESQQFLQTVLDTFPLFVFWKDKNSKYLGCNHKFAKAAGLDTPTAIVGKTDFDLPWSKTEANDYRLEDRTVIDTGQAKLGMIETQLQLDGSCMWKETNKLPLYNLQGEVVGVLGTYQDISDRKAAELALQKSQRFIQQIADASPNILYLYDMQERRNVYVNREIASSLGYSPEEVQKMGANLFVNLVHPDDLGRLAAYYEQIQVAQDGEVFEFEYRMRHISGEWRWLLSRDSVFSRDASGCVQQTIGTAQDITDRKQAETQLQRTNQELVHATRLKDEFLANMSHELRTPLNAILGMSESLQEGVFGPIDERQQRAIAIVEYSGQHLLSLINDILEVSKIEAGKLELDITKVVVTDLCESSLAFVKQQALKKQIQLSTALTSNLGNIDVDERRMRQVLINLLSNSVKFTPVGGRVILEVKLEDAGFNSVEKNRDRQELLDSEGWILFSVTDTGIGISPENHAKLFQPFVQIDGGLNRQYEGTGLGLTMVKQIVELHGGAVSLTSELGQGSCFTVRLPYRSPITPTKFSFN